MTWQGKARKKTFENVKKFWEDSGKKMPTDPRITIRDHYFRLLEIYEIKKLLAGKNKVLDIGCGNGFSTLEYAREVNYIIGADYSKNLINGAKKLLEKNRRANVEFMVSDVLKMPFEKGKFDAVVGERLLINLPNWEMQKDAIEKIARVIKSGGLYICAEVSQQGHQTMDYYRTLFGLGRIEKYWHNLYLDETKFIPFASKYFTISQIKRFGMYQFLSKVVYPLLAAPKEPRFISKFNKVAMEIGKKITNFDDCSHQVMFVLHRR
jgi:ubiquinone/menaquinone biosynthesis C-methylase UbiE